MIPRSKLGDILKTIDEKHSEHKSLVKEIEQKYNKIKQFSVNLEKKHAELQEFQRNLVGTNEETHQLREKHGQLFAQIQQLYKTIDATEKKLEIKKVEANRLVQPEKMEKFKHFIDKLHGYQELTGVHCDIASSKESCNVCLGYIKNSRFNYIRTFHIAKKDCLSISPEELMFSEINKAAGVNWDDLVD